MTELEKLALAYSFAGCVARLCKLEDDLEVTGFRWAIGEVNTETLETAKKAHESCLKEYLGYQAALTTNNLESLFTALSEGNEYKDAQDMLSFLVILYNNYGLKKELKESFTCFKKAC